MSKTVKIASALDHYPDVRGASAASYLQKNHANIVGAGSQLNDYETQDEIQHIDHTTITQPEHLHTVEPLANTKSNLIPQQRKLPSHPAKQHLEAASETTTTDGKKGGKPTTFKPTDKNNEDNQEIGEEIPPNRDSMCLMGRDEVKEPKLQLLDLKNIRLQNIYNKDLEEFKKNIVLGKKTMEPKTFKFELLVCFWLVIHLEFLDFAQFIMDQDPLLEKILQNLRKTGKEQLALEKEKELKKLEEDDDKISQLRKNILEDGKNKKGMLSKMFKNKDKEELEKLEKQQSLNKQASLRRMASMGSQRSQENNPKSTEKKGFIYTDDSVNANNQSKQHLLPPKGKRKRPLNDASATQLLHSAFVEEMMSVIEQKTGIADEEDLRDILWLLKSEAGQTFNTNIMRIALNMEEEKIASILLALYDSKLDDEMVLRAVKTQQIGFLYTMFAFNKNYEELMSKRKFLKLLEVAQAEQDPEAIKQAETARFKIFTFDYIIKKIIDYGEEKGKDLIEEVALWRLKSSENILKSMLKNNMDEIALKYVILYIDYVDTELLAFCILNNNETFLKYCLKNGIYTTLVLGKATLIDEVLRIFKTGTKTELILNVLMYMNLLKWTRQQLKTFVDHLKTIVFENPEKNPITISYNPILVIALACEQLLFIEDNFISIKHECRIVRTRMLILGDKILDNFDDEMLSRVFLDSDFKERTLLKIITQNKFEELFSNYKVGVILEEIWQGKNTFECDGEISDLSLLTHIMKTPIKRLKNVRIRMSEMIFSGFSYSAFKLQKYWFQYKFRSNSISFIFKKDFISALGMVSVFQLINFTYLDLFKDKRYVGFAPLGQRALVQSYIQEYLDINFLGTIFSSGLIFHLICKLIFNCFAYKKMIMDVWTIVDVISAALNLFCFNVIGSVNVDQLIDPAQKRVLDYYVICVTIVSWLRFFSYFYLVQIVSKLLHTLFKMLLDTTSFVFLIICYMAIMSTIFTMLFQVPDPDRFGSVSITLRTLFDAFIGEYAYLDEFPNYALSFQLLTMFHVFVSNIFLLNYLVAILSTVFVYMTERSEFQFMCNKYEFIEKYSVPMLEEGYRELVIHPTPLNFFCFPLVFGIFSKGCMKSMGSAFSKMMYWMENLPFIGYFLVYELGLVIPVYFKQLLSFILKSSWKNIWYLVPFWLICGVPICIVVGVMGDLINLFRVLCDYGQAEEEERIKIEDEFRKDKVILYNEMMDVMRAIMHIYKKREEEERGRRRKMLIKLQNKGNKQTAADFLDQHFLSQDTDGQGYLLEKQLIKQAWAKYRPDSLPNSPREGLAQPKPKDRSDLNQVFGQQFIEKLLKQVKQRLYQGRKQFNFEELKRRHKQMMQQQKKGRGGQDEDAVLFRNDFLGRPGQENEDMDPLKSKSIPQQELQLVDEFLQKFIFIAMGGSTSKSQLDISLALKSLPARIDENNLYRIDMIGFAVVQKALIAFQNDDTDELFIHYDDRNKLRLKKLGNNVVDTEGQSVFLKDLSHKLLQIINGMLKRMNVKDAPDPVLKADTAKSSEIVSRRDRYSRQETHRFGGYNNQIENHEYDSSMSPNFRILNPQQNQQPTFDDIPIQSNYALQQAQKVKAKKRDQSPKQSQKQDPNNPLYMYLPQGMKLKGQDEGKALLGKQRSISPTNAAKEKKDKKPTRFKEKKPAEHVYYPKDYSDFKVQDQNKQKNVHSVPGSINRAPMRNIYRSGGVNFKVDLHKERSMSYLTKSSNVKGHLQKLGVGYDLMQEYLNLHHSSSKQQLNSDLKAQQQQNNNLKMNVKSLNITEEVTPKEKDSLYIFSDQETYPDQPNDEEENIPDTHNLSPIGHQFRIQMPPQDISVIDSMMSKDASSPMYQQLRPPPSGEGIVKKEIEITEQTRSNINLHQNLKRPSADDGKAFESALDAARSLGIDPGSSGADEAGTISGAEINSPYRRKNKHKHKAPKVQWYKHTRSDSNNLKKDSSSAHITTD